MIKMYHYMKSKEDIVDVLNNYKCLHICTYISDLKLLDDISDDFDLEYWLLCLHYWRGRNISRHNEPLKKHLWNCIGWNVVILENKNKIFDIVKCK